MGQVFRVWPARADQIRRLPEEALACGRKGFRKKAFFDHPPREVRLSGLLFSLVFYKFSILSLSKEQRIYQENNNPPKFLMVIFWNVRACNSVQNQIEWGNQNYHQKLWRVRDFLISLRSKKIGMGGVPVKHHSKSKVGRRRAHLALKPTQIFVCGNCKGPVLPHKACSQCHTYSKK